MKVQSVCVNGSLVRGNEHDAAERMGVVYAGKREEEKTLSDAIPSSTPVRYEFLSFVLCFNRFALGDVDDSTCGCFK